MSYFPHDHSIIPTIPNIPYLLSNETNYDLVRIAFFKVEPYLSVCSIGCSCAIYIQ
jgi:hypothetical protein